jgi:hypothetical protein
MLFKLTRLSTCISCLLVKMNVLNFQYFFILPCLTDHFSCERECRTTLIARLSSVYLLFPCVMCKLIKTQFTLMCSISKLNILPCLTSDYFALFGVNTHLDAIHPNTQSPQVSVLWYLIIRWFYSSGWVLVIERLMINLQKLLCLHI